MNPDSISKLAEKIVNNHCKKFSYPETLVLFRFASQAVRVDLICMDNQTDISGEKKTIENEPLNVGEFSKFLVGLVDQLHNPKTKTTSYTSFFTMRLPPQGPGEGKTKFVGVEYNLIQGASGEVSLTFNKHNLLIDKRVGQAFFSDITKSLV
jgi:hypothetical protein